MFEANPCSVQLAGALSQLYTILKSDSWHLVFASLAAARAIVFCCGKSRYYEARELASATILVSIFIFVIAAGESQVPSLVRQMIACKAPETQERIALARMPAKQ